MIFGKMFLDETILPYCRNKIQRGILFQDTETLGIVDTQST